MWLLNTEDPGNPTLEWVFDDKAFETGYAILSHTWEDGEVSHQDIRDLAKARQLRGFRKIELTCYQARYHGLRFAWVDTCCIDKSSSAELSEAINSMYRWYQRARVCYVFLSDIQLSPVIPVRFTSSRWFSRGWTLQELLAPKQLRFFDAQWTYFGDQKSLSIPIARRTGIDTHVLDHTTEITEASVAKKMSWAAGRRTTRLEDIAYCLLGLFDVNMPLLYGEGHRAFQRLQEEILRSSTDHSILLWHRSSSDSSHDGRLLAQSPADFAQCGSVMWSKERSSEQFDLVREGLRVRLMTLPVPHFSEFSYLILNCRYEDDFEGPIALMLEVTDDDSGSIVIGRPMKYAGARHAVVLLRSLKSAAPRSMLLLRQHTPTTIDQTVLHYWFCYSTSFLDSFILVKTEPEKKQQYKASVLSLTPAHFYHERDEAQSYAIWEAVDSNMSVVIAFKSFKGWRGQSFQFRAKVFEQMPTAGEIKNSMPLWPTPWAGQSYQPEAPDSKLAHNIVKIWGAAKCVLTVPGQGLCTIDATHELRMGTSVAVFNLGFVEEDQRRKSFLPSWWLK